MEKACSVRELIFLQFIPNIYSDYVEDFPEKNTGRRPHIFFTYEKNIYSIRRCLMNDSLAMNEMKDFTDLAAAFTGDIQHGFISRAEGRL